MGVCCASIDDRLDLRGGGGLIIRNKSFPGKSYGVEMVWRWRRVSSELPYRVTKLKIKTDEASARTLVSLLAFLTRNLL